MRELVVWGAGGRAGRRGEGGGGGEKVRSPLWVGVCKRWRGGLVGWFFGSFAVGAVGAVRCGSVSCGATEEMTKPTELSQARPLLFLFLFLFLFLDPFFFFFYRGGCNVDLSLK